MLPMLSSRMVNLKSTNGRRYLIEIVQAPMLQARSLKRSVSMSFATRALVLVLVEECSRM
jgi:hypothetical protein